MGSDVKWGGYFSTINKGKGKSESKVLQRRKNEKESRKKKVIIAQLSVIDAVLFGGWGERGMIKRGEKVREKERHCKPYIEI